MPSGGFTVYPAPRINFRVRSQDDENVMLSRMVTEAPRMPWDRFTEQLDWRYGEHFFLNGPTGQGKTNMLRNLLPFHRYVTVMATKPRDESMDAIVREGYYPLKQWRSMDPREYPKRVLWPDARDLNSDETQREEFHKALSKIYREGGWTVAVDETWWFTNVLGLGKDLKTYLLQGRSLGISLLAATQRPANVPVEFYDQSTHLMFWRDNDENNLRRISGIGWKSSSLIREIVSGLEQFQVLYVNTRTGQMMRTRAPYLAT